VRATQSGATTAEVNVICQPSHPRANYHLAFAPIPLSIFGVDKLFGRKMNSFFKQARGMHLDCTANCARLTVSVRRISRPGKPGNSSRAVLRRTRWRASSARHGSDCARRQL